MRRAVAILASARAEVVESDGAEAQAGGVAVRVRGLVVECGSLKEARAEAARGNAFPEGWSVYGPYGARGRGAAPDGLFEIWSADALTETTLAEAAARLGASQASLEEAAAACAALLAESFALEPPERGGPAEWTLSEQAFGDVSEALAWGRSKIEESQILESCRKSEPAPEGPIRGL